jgi:transcriptional regulator with XRE-family HTH domain
MVMDVAGQFGDNVARIRRQAALSQDEVAVRASLHRTEVSQIERGLRLARVDTVAKLAAALEADPGELFQGIAWEPGDIRHGQFKPDPPDTL